MSAEPRVERDELIVLNRLVPLAAQDIIELGCGAARLARELLARYPATRVTGLEVDAIQHARNLAAPAERLRFIAAGAQAIPLPDARLLMVVNIHAVNFSLGVDVYSKQLLPIGDQIAHHSGPVIMAGDFNAWSRPRMNALYRFAREMSLREVRFSDDQRRRAFGRPLDFVFYRGLSVHDASVLVTRASDHNPLLVEFSPGKPD